MQYLMVWMGVTSGGFAGRDDGYPEQKTMLIESLDRLVQTYRPDAHYYKLVPVDVNAAVQAVKDLQAYNTP